MIYDTFAYEIPIRISNKMSRSLGKYVYYDNGVYGIEPVEFSFSGKLVDGRYKAEDVESVIKHEYVHYLVNYRTKKAQGHNEMFRRYCRELNTNGGAITNIKPIVNVPVEEKEEVKEKKKQDFKYEILCTCCGKVVGYRDRISDSLLKKYTSGCCRAKLTYRLNEKK